MNAFGNKSGPVNTSGGDIVISAQEPIKNEAPMMEKKFVREQSIRDITELLEVIQALDNLDFMFTVEKQQNINRITIFFGQAPPRFKVTIYEPTINKIVGPSEVKGGL